jgi:hypothetical protein
VANYDAIYAPFSVLVIGDPAMFAVSFGSTTTLLNFLPTIGTANSLTADYVDPLTTSAGVFAGDVAALKLNVDFSDAGLLGGAVAYRFGDLVLHGLTTTTDFNGLTVREALGSLNAALGGLPTSDSYADLDLLAAQLDSAFFFTDQYTPSLATQFTQDHLDAPVPEPATLLLAGSASRASRSRGAAGAADAIAVSAARRLREVDPSPAQPARAQEPARGGRDHGRIARRHAGRAQYPNQRPDEAGSTATGATPPRSAACLRRFSST